MRICVDGCSYAAAYGLPSEFKLANLINACYDLSYCGKGNQAIFHDVYKNIDAYDAFVISMSHPDRFQLFDSGVRVNILPTDWGIKRFEGTIFKDDVQTYHKILYTLYDQTFYSTLSDAIVDSLIALFEIRNKKYAIFTWSDRNSMFKSKVYQMKFNKENFLPDHHLNENGMKKWAKLALEKLNE